MEHRQTNSNHPVSSALARFILGVTLLFAGFSVQAGTLTLQNFVIYWDAGLTPKTGGTATVEYWSLDYQTVLGTFKVNVADFAEAEAAGENIIIGVDNWLTPVAGSDITFDPVDLIDVKSEYHNIYETSFGLGQLGASGPRLFDGFLAGHVDYSKWEVTEISQSTNVPEPGVLALTLLGLAGLASSRRKNASSN
jgi:hypothetical protein